MTDNFEGVCIAHVVCSFTYLRMERGKSLFYFIFWFSLSVLFVLWRFQWMAVNGMVSYSRAPGLFKMDVRENIISLKILYTLWLRDKILLDLLLLQFLREQTLRCLKSFGRKSLVIHKFRLKCDCPGFMDCDILHDGLVTLWKYKIYGDKCSRFINDCFYRLRKNISYLWEEDYYKKLYLKANNQHSTIPTK